MSKKEDNFSGCLLDQNSFRNDTHWGVEALTLHMGRGVPSKVTDIPDEGIEYQ